MTAMGIYTHVKDSILRRQSEKLGAKQNPAPYTKRGKLRKRLSEFATESLFLFI